MSWWQIAQAAGLVLVVLVVVYAFLDTLFGGFSGFGGE